MGTSTITTFGPNGPVVTTTGGTIRPVTVRALGAQQRAIEASQQAQARARSTPTTVYRGNGQYSTLGASGSYAPAGSATSGGVPVGAVVPSNGGIVGGMPAGTPDLSSRVALLEQRLAQVAQERGPQIGTGAPLDPDTEEPTKQPRYSQDFYYDADAGALWQWQTSTESEPATWIVVAGATEALPFRIDAPENTTYVLDAYQHYAVRVEALEGVTGGTVSTSPALGEIAAIGTGISITVSGSDSGTPCLGSILLRRVG
jgi:hypothetical protein